ncbi:MAG: response regulator, partial [Candidatus Promineifilaceae bacterium]
MNRKYRILVAEDQEVLAKNAREFLESRGYEVVMAYTPQEALQILADSWVHAAVVDMRLDDNSDLDRTGLRVLKNSSREIPKLIWTAYPDNYQDVVEAMKKDEHGPLPPAVNFVAKRDGLPNLEEAVRDALKTYMPLNVDLRIEWRSYLSFSQLTEIIFAQNGRFDTNDLAHELEDLFRLLFRATDTFKSPQITIDQLLIPGKGYAILGVYVFKEDGSNIPYIVTFGQKEVVKKEAVNFKEAVPRPIQTSNLVKDNEAATTHFAATAYRLVEGQLDTIVSFATYYHTNELAMIQKCVKNLYHNNLVHWYRQGREEKSVSALHQFYLQTYRTLTNEAYKTRLADNLAQICNTVAPADLGRVHLTAEWLELSSPLSETRKLVNPTLLLEKSLRISESVQWGRIHGQVSTETILVDKNARTWLIDFTQVCTGPLLHEFTHFEVQMKAALLGRRKLSTILAFEQALLTQEGDDSVAPDDMGKMFQVVRSLHGYAQRLTLCSVELYQLSLYYQAIAYLLTFDNERLYTQVELQPYVHMMLTASLLATQFSQMEPGVLP